MLEYSVLPVATRATCDQRQPPSTLTESVRLARAYHTGLLVKKSEALPTTPRPCGVSQPASIAPSADRIDQVGRKVCVAEAATAVSLKDSPLWTLWLKALALLPNG